MICRCFPPVYTTAARVLIVGSMPSVKSLADAQYYAHPRNAFWPILFDIFGEAPTSDYEAKKALICRNRLALWDAAAACEREGSLDSSMRDIAYNDFSALFAECPHIHTVLCNGAAAHSMFLKAGFAGGRRICRMPSTSPAYTMPYNKKKEIWKAALVSALLSGGTGDGSGASL
ncbi:MAG: DNA-deoxyinosine glycosylase [Clostridia bacterium]|nr:DNA-deoxyinosine glycosylase [Clostridia bacterium]